MVNSLNSALDNQVLFIILIFVFGIISACTPCFIGNLTIYFKHINNSNDKKKSTSFLILGIILNLFLMAFIFMEFNQYFSLNNDYINLFIGLLLIFIGYDILPFKQVNSCKIVKKNSNHFLYFINGFTLMFLTSTCVSPVLLYIMLNVAVSNTILGYTYIFIYSLGFTSILILFLFFNKLIEKMKMKYGHILFYINILLGVLIISLGLRNIYLILFL